MAVVEALLAAFTIEVAADELSFLNIFTFKVPDWNFRVPFGLDAAAAAAAATAVFKLFKLNRFSVLLGAKKSLADFKFTTELIWAEFFKLRSLVVGVLLLLLLLFTPPSPFAAAATTTISFEFV